MVQPGQPGLVQLAPVPGRPLGERREIVDHDRPARIQQAPDVGGRTAVLAAAAARCSSRSTLITRTPGLRPDTSQARPTPAPVPVSPMLVIAPPARAESSRPCSTR